MGTLSVLLAICAGNSPVNDANETTLMDIDLNQTKTQLNFEMCVTL